MKKVTIHVLANNPVLRPYAQMIKKEADKAVKIIAKYISVAEIDIIIAHRPNKIEHGRVSVKIKNKHLSNIAINVKNKNFTKFVYKDLLEAIAYVLYRATRLQRIGYSKNLFEDCVEEGLAFNFQTEVSGDKSEPYFMTTKNI